MDGGSVCGSAELSEAETVRKVIDALNDNSFEGVNVTYTMPSMAKLAIDGFVFGHAIVAADGSVSICLTKTAIANGWEVVDE